MKNFGLPHSERFDKVEVRVDSEWRNTGQSGGLWLFTYSADFYFHGQVVATIKGTSLQDCLLRAAAEFETVEVDEERVETYKRMFCCHPGCPEPWVVLKHPSKRYSPNGEKFEDDYDSDVVRPFCMKHQGRGNSGLDDRDSNYYVIDSD